MKDLFDLSDEIGPARIVHINQPAIGLQAIVVVDNVAAGPAIGGTRMAVDVDVNECLRLARAMTYKNAAAGLAHGGAKSVIKANPKMPAADKEQLIRGFAVAIKHLTDYIPGPDMGTNEQAMAWIHDEIGRSVGLPRVVGGIPLDEIGATGLGVAVATEVAQNFCDVTLRGARVAVQGFGAVGEHAARQLVGRGATVVAVADSKCAISNPGGIDVDQLVQHKRNGLALSDLPGAQVIPQDSIVSVDCDILVPAARPDVINETNAAQIKARLVVQGANIPATAQAEAVLQQRGILCVPDFIANAGGVICAAVEYHNGSESAALNAIVENVRRNTEQVLSRAKDTDSAPRDAATQIARTRVRSAMKTRRWH